MFLSTSVNTHDGETPLGTPFLGRLASFIITYLLYSSSVFPASKYVLWELARSQRQTDIDLDHLLRLKNCSHEVSFLEVFSIKKKTLVFLMRKALKGFVFNSLVPCSFHTGKSIWVWVWQSELTILLQPLDGCNYNNIKMLYLDIFEGIIIPPVQG